MKFIDLVPISWLYFASIPPLFVKHLNKKTWYKENQLLNPKLFNLFFFFGPICFIFIKQIKEKRKLEYMEGKLSQLNTNKFINDE